MSPSKEWMNFFDDRNSGIYRSGVEEFLNYAFERTSDDFIRCPCIKCNNTDSASRKEVKGHLIMDGIMQNYTTWYHHGERFGEPLSGEEDSNEINHDDGIREVLRGMYNFDNCAFEKGSSSQNEHKEEPNDEANAFYRLLTDSEQPIYPGSEISKLSVLVNLLHIKSIGRWSNESFDMLLKFLKQILPDGSTLPESYYDAKKIRKDLGLSYKKIDACVNDCMLYWKEECGASRWKIDRQNGESNVKIMVRLLRWHHEKRVDDGVMRF